MFKKSKKKFWSISNIFFLLMFLVILVLSILWIRDICGISKNDFNKINSVLFEDFKGNNPELKFETVKFYKYLIHGRVTEKSKKLDKLVIFNMRGSADFLLEFSKIFYDKDNNIILIDDEKEFPVKIKVDTIDITKVDEIKPQEFSIEEANSINKIVSIGLTSAGGSLVGGVIGSQFGVGKIGMLLGGVLGGVVGNYAEFDIVSNFIAGRTLADPVDEKEVEDSESRAKKLVECELLYSYGVIDNEKEIKSEDDVKEFSEKTRARYKEELEIKIKDLIGNLGASEKTLNKLKFSYASEDPNVLKKIKDLKKTDVPEEKNESESEE